MKRVRKRCFHSSLTDFSVGSETESDISVHESAHEKKVRLTKKAIQKALETGNFARFFISPVGSDDEKYEALSLRLKEEALQAKGKFLAKFAHQVSVNLNKSYHSDQILE